MKKFSFLILLPLLVLCSKHEKKDVLAVIGKTSIDRNDYEVFSKVKRYYPTELCDEFPAFRSLITEMVETEAIFQKAKNYASSSIKNSLDWQWKQNFYAAQIYMTEQLMPNMGATEDQIKNYYNTHKENFKKTVKADSTRDSTFYQELSEVRDAITQILFLQKFPVEADFKSRIDKEDSATINEIWFSSCKRNAPNFFMKAFYKDKFQKDFPDSINEIYGDNKTLTPEDMKTIISWIRPEYRSQYENEKGTRRLADFLMQWKLFSEKANQLAFTSTPAFKEVMGWAWKVEVVNQYVKNEIVAKVKNNLKIDTSLIQYVIYDESNSVLPIIDTSLISNKLNDLAGKSKKLAVDSLIFEIRKETGVKFLQNDLRDNKDQDPLAIARQADSLRDTGSVEEAEKLYNTLANDFLFTPQGNNAQYELAKIQTERQSYSSAISNYRNYLLSSPDPKKKSITFFMIGFIYDEYLDKSELAEANYKWVLKNDPKCELADDAEFMMLHLGEPMNSVEELQAQTLRQNRKVESFEEAALQETHSESASEKSNESLAKK